MRIIGGKYKGKVLKAPSDLPVRPTTDFAKTGLFNILSSRIDFSACSVLDLFSGTGNISFEFISRNSKHVTSVDKNNNCIQFLNKIKKQLVISNMSVVKSDVLSFLTLVKGNFQIIFADPPYDYTEKEKIYELIFKNKLIGENGIFILEHKTGEEFELLPGFSFSRSYGNVSFSFFYNFE